LSTGNETKGFKVQVVEEGNIGEFRDSTPAYMG
jgi:hypothetical protein